MEIKLVYYKQEITRKSDKKVFKVNTFYVEMPNGVLVRVLPNSYKDEEGKFHTNEKELLLLAECKTK